MCLVLHEPVCEPSCHKRSADTSYDFRCGYNVSRKVSFHSLELCEEGCSPFKDGETDDIDAEVRKSKDPDDRIAEDKLLEEIFVSAAFQLLFRFVFCALVLIVQCFNFRKAYR